MTISRRQRRRQEAVGQKRSEKWQRESLCSRAEIGPVLDQIVSAMSRHEYPEKDLFAVRLALEEAVVNALRHGHQDDGKRPVRVRFQVAAEAVLVEVKDEGPGFDPATVPDPCAPENLERSCGRGLLLMKSYMTWVCFNTRGNCVTMGKSRSPVGIGDRKVLSGL